VIRLQERIAEPRLAFEGFVTFDLTLTHWASWIDAHAALYATSPRGAGQSARGCFVSYSKMISPWRARYSRAASSSEAYRGLRVGIKATGTIVAYLFFLKHAHTLTTELDPGLLGQHRGEFAATPLRVDGAMLEGVLINEAIEVLL